MVCSPTERQEDTTVTQDVVTKSEAMYSCYKLYQHYKSTKIIDDVTEGTRRVTNILAILLSQGKIYKINLLY